MGHAPQSGEASRVARKTVDHSAPHLARALSIEMWGLGAYLPNRMKMPAEFPTSLGRLMSRIPRHMSRCNRVKD